MEHNNSAVVITALIMATVFFITLAQQAAIE